MVEHDLMSLLLKLAENNSLILSGKNNEQEISILKNRRWIGLEVDSQKTLNLRVKR